MTIEEQQRCWESLLDEGTVANIHRRYLAGQLPIETERAIFPYISPQILLAVAVRDLTAVIGAKR